MIDFKASLQSLSHRWIVKYLLCNRSKSLLLRVGSASEVLNPHQHTETNIAAQDGAGSNDLAGFCIASERNHSLWTDMSDQT